MSKKRNQVVIFQNVSQRQFSWLVAGVIFSGLAAAMGLLGVAVLAWLILAG